MSGSTVSRTYPRVPYAAFSKGGEPLDLDDVLNGIRTDAELVAHYALRELTEQNLALVTYFNGLKPAEAGRQMNLKLPTEVKKRCLSVGEDVPRAGGVQPEILGRQIRSCLWELHRLCLGRLEKNCQQLQAKDIAAQACSVRHRQGLP